MSHLKKQVAKKMGGKKVAFKGVTSKANYKAHLDKVYKEEANFSTRKGE